MKEADWLGNVIPRTELARIHDGGQDKARHEEHHRGGYGAAGWGDNPDESFEAASVRSLQHYAHRFDYEQGSVRAGDQQASRLEDDIPVDDAAND